MLLSTLQSLLLKDSLTWLVICLMITLLTLFELRADPSSEYLLGYVLLKLLFTMWYIRQKTVNGLNSKVKLCVLTIVDINLFKGNYSVQARESTNKGR